MENLKFNTYKVTYLKGEVGSAEFWTEEDWVEHRKYVEKLKAEGEYLKPVEYTMNFAPFDIFDSTPVIPFKDMAIVFPK